MFNMLFIAPCSLIIFSAEDGAAVQYFSNILRETATDRVR